MFPNRFLQSHNPHPKFRAIYISMVIFGIRPPVNTFNSDPRSDFALKTQIPSFNLNMEIAAPEKSVGDPLFCKLELYSLRQENHACLKLA